MFQLSYIWSITAGICLTFGSVHFLFWLKQRDAWANLAFSTAALAAAGYATIDLSLLQSETPALFAELMQLHLVLSTVVLLALVTFIRIYFEAGSWWLFWMIFGLRMVILVLNFVPGPTFYFHEITGLDEVAFGQEVLVRPIGVAHPWVPLIQLSHWLVIAFVIDAARSAKRVEPKAIRVVAGLTLASIVLAMVSSILRARGILPTGFVGQLMLLPIAGIAYQLSLDLMRASQLARALKTSESRLRLAASAAELGLWEWEVARDEIWATEVTRAQIGADASESIDFKRFLRAVHPDDLERVQDLVRSSLETGTPLEAECRVSPSAGLARWVILRGEVEPDANGVVHRIRGVLLDITSRKQSELRYQNMQETLAQASRVSTMGQLAAALAHEISQPLGAILRNAEAAELFLRRDPPDLGMMKEILSDIRRDDQRAGAVIEKLRSMMKRRQPTLASLVVKELLEDAATLIRAELQGQQTHLTIDVPPDLPPVQGDRVQLQQVLLNLLLNGLQAMENLPPEKRRLVMQARRVDDEEVELAVMDCGTGLEADAMANLFEPFKTTKSEGLGIGLAVSWVIVKSHGGQLRAENNPADGATFRFSLKVSNRARDCLENG